ncbi:MAG: Hsp70 family protein [Thermoguttaceae bacterium]
MTRQSPPAIGIDLGTTYSALACLEPSGQPVMLVNAEGDRSTPSMVLFDGEDVIVGKEALKAFTVEPWRVAECSKRDMGQRVYHKVLDGKQYPPEVIAAFILNKLRVDAVAQIGPFEKVVITVPAYFDEVRRKATQDAGYMAGFDVMDIINEPTAAAVAFGFHRGYVEGNQPAARPQRVVVYDLGGGTFDVTVMEIRGTDYRTLATDGDVQLGGYDWDQRLMDIVAEKFIRKYSVDPREDPRTAGRLWQDCEDAKRTLSARLKAAVPCEYQGHRELVEVTRLEFEEATQDLLDRTRFTVTQTIKAAGLAWNQVDRILLTGGSTRMPMVRNMILQLAGKQPDTSVAADEAVAYGAALRAGLLLARTQGKPPAFRIRNVNSHSLGVVGIDPKTRRKRSGILIPRNTPIPATARRTFRTHKANQKSILVEIVEGENPSPDECTLIGRCTIRKLPPNLPKRSPVHVAFHYKPNGRLKVRVSVPRTESRLETEFTRENSLPKEHLDGWRRYISGAEPTQYC